MGIIRGGVEGGEVRVDYFVSFEFMLGKISQFSVGASVTRANIYQKMSYSPLPRALSSMPDKRAFYAIFIKYK